MTVKLGLYASIYLIIAFLYYYYRWPKVIDN